jgi:shikimate dehydrogenase
MDKFGLIGKHIDYSFSRTYFKQKFENESINASYVNFDLSDITEFKAVLKEKKLKGLNVTIPYKTEIISFLDEIETEANEIGAVNTIKFTEDKLIGFNTDVYGFVNSIKPLLKKHQQSALVLGSGGASKAICYGLAKLNIDYKIVTRTPSEPNQINYDEVNEDLLKTYHIIINCTPLGTYPKVEEAPQIPYQFLSSQHLLYDLVYNPKETAFMKKGKAQGCQTTNGYKMLVLQAEKAWAIWNS